MIQYVLHTSHFFFLLLSEKSRQKTTESVWRGLEVNQSFQQILRRVGVRTREHSVRVTVLQKYAFQKDVWGFKKEVYSLIVSSSDVKWNIQHQVKPVKKEVSVLKIQEFKKVTKEKLNPLSGPRYCSGRRIRSIASSALISQTCACSNVQSSAALQPLQRGNLLLPSSQHLVERVFAYRGSAGEKHEGLLDEADKKKKPKTTKTRV